MMTPLLACFLAVLAACPGAHAAARSTPPQPRLQRVAEVLTKPFAPDEAAISSTCRQHSQLYLHHLTQLAPWALQMYDSSTKIPASIMAGNIQQLGNFDQCVAIRMASDTGSDVFRGKHCTAQVSFRMPAAAGESPLGDLLLAAATASGAAPSNTSAAFDWAYCVPSSCSSRDVEAALSLRLATLVGPTAARPIVTVDDGACLSADTGRQNTPLQANDIAFICLLLVTMYIIGASTIYDVICTAPKEDVLTPGSKSSAPRTSRLQEMFVAFSLRRNGAALLSTARSGDTMGCLHGLRVLSISWVVLLHSFYMEAVSPNINRAVVPKLGDSWGNMVLMNATLSTDTFLLLSGALLAISFLRSSSKAPEAAFNPLPFYLHRYVRLTPVYAVVMWFYASLLVRLGSGPLWDRLVGVEADNCRANWWTNLAYVNNFVQISAPCMNQTWYLAVDMQLFWLSPLVLLPLRWWPRLGRALLAALALVSVAVPFTITFVERLPGAMLYTLDQSLLGQVFVQVYTRVYNRAGPYLVGIALGCVLTRVRGRAVRLSGLVVAAGWTASTAMCLAVLFGVFGFYQRWHTYSPLEAALYAGLHRTVWAAGVAWVVFACVTGHGGPAEALLSWRPFGPMARLSYCVYLTHYAVIMVSHGLRRAPGYFSTFLTIQGAMGTLVTSFVISAVLSLAYEMPFMALDRVLLQRARPAGPSSKKAVAAAAVPVCSVATVEAVDGRAVDGRPDLHGYDNAAFETMAEK
ncbi:nose resistant to fluoxetine protein 6-like [Thrips palmi]|uniref:Nose resistant to fluoxetine protein 6-like n=1 Tax=Thrips palmi TaxID=161013 RepID=A0A6P8ZX37_THRPL|nr:nose resistant to fluoxetine protein 6-like [Thrips palmi]XP_034249387.1 nose resistant to fluoxetine protein 6-like [Thrips palmi]